MFTVESFPILVSQGILEHNKLVYCLDGAASQPFLALAFPVSVSEKAHNAATAAELPIDVQAFGYVPTRDFLP